MDYFDQADFTRHTDWKAFLSFVDSQRVRIILLTSKTSNAYHEFQFQNDDILLFGSESTGVPDHVKDRADERITIKMKNGMRSLNLAVSAGIALGEALKQTGQFAK